MIHLFTSGDRPYFIAWAALPTKLPQPVSGPLCPPPPRPGAARHVPVPGLHPEPIDWCTQEDGGPQGSRKRRRPRDRGRDPRLPATTCLVFQATQSPSVRQVRRAAADVYLLCLRHTLKVCELMDTPEISVLMDANRRVAFHVIPQQL